MRLIAHRGFADVAPENTVGAIRTAAESADVVEFDVRRCGSGELVVIHDETVDRVTDGVGLVADHSLAELRSLAVLGSDESIPTLTTALAAVPPSVGVHLELKEPGLAADALAALDGVDDAVVTSFLESELRAVREHDQDRRTGLLTSDLRETPVTTAIELDCDVVGVNYWRCLATPVVDRAHDLGLEVYAWSIRSRALATLLAYRGVDGISSDRPLSL